MCIRDRVGREPRRYAGVLVTRRVRRLRFVGATGGELLRCMPPSQPPCAKQVLTPDTRSARGTTAPYSTPRTSCRMARALCSRRPRALSTPTNAVRAHAASLAKESSWGHKDGLPKEAVGPGPLDPGGV